MVWKSTSRKQELPPNWEELRQLVLKRDKRSCRICGAYATHVDHIKRGNDHSLANLQALCASCHGKKTSREGKEARYGITPRRGKQFEPHPGIKNPG